MRRLWFLSSHQRCAANTICLIAILTCKNILYFRLSLSLAYSNSVARLNFFLYIICQFLIYLLSTAYQNVSFQAMPEAPSVPSRPVTVVVASAMYEMRLARYGGMQQWVVFRQLWWRLLCALLSAAAGRPIAVCVLRCNVRSKSAYRSGRYSYLLSVRYTAR